MTHNNMNPDKQPILQGKLYGAADDHAAYAIYYAAPEILDEISRILVDKFGCTQPNSPSIGWNNVMITHCRKDTIELALGWDPLSGFCISSDSDEGDDLVKQIGVYLNTIIGGKDFEKYIRPE